MKYFPVNNDEISLIKFIARYQYLNIRDAKYFFNSSRYYRNRIKNLIKKNFLRKIKWTLVLGQSGIKYVKLLKFEYNPMNKNKKYIERLLKLSNLGAFYNKCETVDFIPSFELKDKGAFTTTGRRFVGVFNINGFEYLAYQINAKQDNTYIESVVFDIQKEMNYKNFIILINNINRIKLSDFAFGKNEILIIEDNIINREKLKYLHSINWYKILREYYGKIYLSEYSFCEYDNKKDIFINIFYFLDAEKINRFRHFIRQSNTKRAYIVCDNELEHKLKEELSEANYCIINLEDHIDKEQRCYYTY